MTKDTEHREPLADASLVLLRVALELHGVPTVDERHARSSRLVDELLTRGRYLSFNVRQETGLEMDLVRSAQQPSHGEAQ